MSIKSGMKYSRNLNSLQSGESTLLSYITRNNLLPPVNGKEAGILFNAPLRGVSFERAFCFSSMITWMNALEYKDYTLARRLSENALLPKLIGIPKK
ncbi:MAG: hypothetical protein GQ542_11650 [Desulforhopalus sp.]|nr:hypothetical protein [Desulforhopalus sp.]